MGRYLLHVEAVVPHALDSELYEDNRACLQIETEHGHEISNGMKLNCEYIMHEN